LSIAEIVVSLLLLAFAAAFGMWAKRLDKALDLLEKIQEQGHKQAILTERRLVRLESAAEHCGAFGIPHREKEEEDTDG